MKNRRWLLFPAIFALVFLASGFDGFFIRPRGVLLKMHLRAQHRDWWCWAAATEMISDYLGRRITQCDSVMYVTGHTWCNETCECESGWGDTYGADLDQMKDNWEHWDFDFKHLVAPLSWTDLAEEISNRRRPVFAAWSWVGGGGHVLVVNGYAQPSGRDLIFSILRRNDYVLYKDPWPPDCDHDPGYYVCTAVSGGDEAASTYAVFVNDGEHVWDNTLYHFRDTLP